MHAPPDSTADPRLLGDTITPIIQFIFQQPPWVMWGGVLLAAVILFVIGRWAWPRRATAREWLVSRSRGIKLLLAGSVVVLLIVAATGGYAGYHFVETDKRFCNGCHIFVASGQQWVPSDTGNYTLVPKLEGRHDSLSCHSCHPLKPMKEAVKLVLWMSGVRDSTIPPHAKVPRETCERCHVQGEAKATWQAVAATAGHRAHLESDSAALHGKVECLTCHARTAHRFPPVNATCGQSGCHNQDETRIVLGKMAKVDLAFHCTGCHNFTAEVPRLATRDSAAGVLRPALQQCFRCHEMKARIPDFDPARDPHGGTCGMCHNPHTQTAPAAAKASCATAGCHADWRKEPFHLGEQHRAMTRDCTTCHTPHAARVDASNCAGCHAAVRARKGSRLHPPLPFDTTAALRSQALDSGDDRPSKVKGDSPLPDDPPPAPPPPRDAVSAAPATPADSFAHSRHQKLPCLTCHRTESRHGALTFERPRGCQICHHQAPARSDCTACHDHIRDSVPVSFTIAAARQPPHRRTVAFRHEWHTGQRCIACHGEPVSLAPVDSARTCSGCHQPHHESARDCASCHREVASATAAHQRQPESHVRCDDCHATRAIAELTPTRSFCLSCHEARVDHYRDRQCSTCHLQATPEAYQSHLRRAKGTP
ncbi:MAG TPA: hypothetical protein VG817_01385 [Gemmatimonadales bacterium]|nr:hypothetical protein [Gemmatimonadales bacterium]